MEQNKMVLAKLRLIYNSVRPLEGTAAYIVSQDRNYDELQWGNYKFGVVTSEGQLITPMDIINIDFANGPRCPLMVVKREVKNKTKKYLCNINTKQFLNKPFKEIMAGYYYDVIVTTKSFNKLIIGMDLKQKTEVYNSILPIESNGVKAYVIKKENKVGIMGINYEIIVPVVYSNISSQYAFLDNILIGYTMDQKSKESIYIDLKEKTIQTYREFYDGGVYEAHSGSIKQIYIGIKSGTYYRLYLSTLLPIEKIPKLIGEQYIQNGFNVISKGI